MKKEKIEKITDVINEGTELKSRSGCFRARLGVVP